MSIRELECFVTVAEEGHVGRAARRLRIAQPPVSRHIQALEHELGVALFERTPRGMRLSPEGETFLPHARGILSSIDAARRAVTTSTPRERPSRPRDER